MSFPKFKIVIDELSREINSIEDLETVKEDLYMDGIHFNTLILIDEENNVFSEFKKRENKENILVWLKNKGIDISKYIRTNTTLTSINNKNIEAIVGKEEMIFIAEHENFNQKDFVLISIQDPDDKDDLSIYQNRFKKHLAIRFFDVEEDLHVKSGGFPVIPLNNEEAKQLADFIKENKKEKFFIHCAAGMSRSAGVGLAVNCIVNHNGSKYNASQFPSDIKAHFRYCPNLVVYDKIIENYMHDDDNRIVCKKCDARFDEPIKGLKNGSEILNCPSCFKEIE